MSDDFDVITNTEFLKFGDIFFCTKEAEKYLTKEVVKKAGLIYCESGIISRNKALFSTIDIKDCNFNVKIRQLNKKQFKDKLVKLLKKRYPIKCKLIAITGTKGKTSTCWFIMQILAQNGIKCGYIGTLGVYFADNKKIKKVNTNHNSLTTPSIDDLYKNLYLLTTLDVKVVVFEVSSHALQQDRIDGLKISCAGFTNLSQDHLDYHLTMNKYFKAKSLLFSRFLKKNGIALLNRDDEKFEELRKICNTSCIRKIFSFGKTDNSNLQIAKIQQSDKKQIVSIIFDKKKYMFSTEILGEFQIYNIVLAIAVCSLQYHININTICKNILNLVAPTGRMEKIFNTQFDNEADIFVDFAHTPKSLEESLMLLRDKYRFIIVVFGCGGNRDKKKRPIMFEIAFHICDYVIITDDNPRCENNEDIINDIICYQKQDKNNILLKDEFVLNEIQAIRNKYATITHRNNNNFTIITNRADAIKFAISKYKNNKDTAILIAGKGHEDYQIIGKEKKHFSDKEEILKNLK